MANVRLVPEKVTPGGLTAAQNGSLNTADTHQVRNDGRTMLHFKKTGAGNAIITVQTPRTVNGLAIAEQTFTVPATTGDVYAGPFAPAVFNDANGDLNFTSDDTTGLTVAVLIVP